jgi:hypothetical protein
MEERVTKEAEERFGAALSRVLSMDQTRAGIGQLAEKKLHLTLKYYFQPDEEFHEQQIGRHVADAVTVGGIVEVQTAGYGRLGDKLSVWSPLVPVTVVCPIPHRKALVWIDPETGALVRESKSPKKGCWFDAFWELAHIRSHLCLPNVTFLLCLLDVREYRLLNKKGGTRHSSRKERVPTALCGFYALKTKEDFQALLPPDLPALFTVKDLSRLIGRNEERTRSVLYVMEGVGAVRRAGKDGNRILYRISGGEKSEE